MVKIANTFDVTRPVCKLKISATLMYNIKYTDNKYNLIKKIFMIKFNVGITKINKRNNLGEETQDGQIFILIWCHCHCGCLVVCVIIYASCNFTSATVFSFYLVFSFDDDDASLATRSLRHIPEFLPNYVSQRASCWWNLRFLKEVCCLLHLWTSNALCVRALFILLF